MESFITTNDGVRIAYRIDGAAHLPALVLSNSIGTNYTMWDGQIAELSQHYRVVRFDTRGQGKSEVPPGPYSMDRFGHDVLDLMDALGIARAHFLGLSLGGWIGQWLAIHRPERVGKLILSNTAAWLGPDGWSERISSVLADPGMRESAEVFLKNWFPAGMYEENGPEIKRFRAMLHATDPRGMAGAYAALRDADQRRTVRLIEAPTLVIAGIDDTVTTARHGEELAAAIPGARLVMLPGVHLSNVEQPAAYMDAVMSWLAG